MSNRYEQENANEVKAINSFNEFLDCVMKADLNTRKRIGSEVALLLIEKANHDEELDKVIQYALNVIKAGMC